MEAKRERVSKQKTRARQRKSKRDGTNNAREQSGCYILPLFENGFSTRKTVTDHETGVRQ
jgi:hypothetical protein